MHGMNDFYGSAEEENSIKVLNRSIEIGCNFWDTAELYGNGENHRLLSKVLKDRRNEVFLCTKFGLFRDENNKFSIILIFYYQHRVDPNTPIEDTVSALAELVNEGKVKYIGLSECSAETLRHAYKVHPIAADQIEYSPWTLDIEANGLMEACKELGVTIVAYSPFGQGILTGNYKSIHDFGPDDLRRKISRFQRQLCLAWVISQGDNIVVIPGTKKIKYLEENYDAVKVNLSSDEFD
ncbi:aldo/keto reductase [Rhizophagus clarus]|uniref:Aldo/keto reductase n=1 Tax=Rhizophagus clarus TaxID=94130 RepID=A0A8H3KVU0_9GLOM|nr:aldo/keto reductase [Rhizophagus clarus]